MQHGNHHLKRPFFRALLAVQGLAAVRGLAAVLGLAAASAAQEAVARAREPKAPAPASAPAPGYVDDRVCGDCHDQLYRSFLETDKGRSFHRPGPDKVIESFEDGYFFHQKSLRHYQMILRDGRYLFRRYQLDDQGEQINLLEQEVDWIQGSGSFSRVYFYQTPAGELYQLPVSWYSADRRWGMAPGFDRPDHRGIRRQVRRECHFCHNAAPGLPPGGDRYGALQLFPPALPEGIGCQRCHGPGAEHARLAAGGTADEDAVRDAILDPGWLPTDLLNDVCYQCHARASSFGIFSLPRFGQGDYSFRPGEPLANYLVEMEITEATQGANGHVTTYSHNQMEQSRCYVESKGRMSCTTCHDSHHRVRASEKAAAERAICSRCHPRDAAHSRAAAPDRLAAGVDALDCVACHMPKRTSDTAHLAISDHSIPRRPSGGEQLPPLPDEYDPVFVDARVIGIDGDLGQLYRAAVVVNAGAGDQAVDALGSMIVATRPEEIEPYLILARGLLHRRRWQKAREVLGVILSRDPGNLAATEWLGLARAGLGRPAEAIDLLRHLLERDRGRPEAQFNLGLLLKETGQTEAAVVELGKAVALRPSQPSAWFHLGQSCARLERLDDAVRYYRRALEIDPAFTAAYLELGRILLRRGNRDQALRFWRHGAKVAGRPEVIAEAMAGLSGRQDETAR